MDNLLHRENMQFYTNKKQRLMISFDAGIFCSQFELIINPPTTVILETPYLNLIYDSFLKMYLRYCLRNAEGDRLGL